MNVPGQPPASVALVGLQRSDMRLLTAAEKLGPLVTEAVKLAAAQQRDPAVASNGTSATSAPSPKRPTANGTAKKPAAGVRNLQPLSKSSLWVIIQAYHKAEHCVFSTTGTWKG